MTPTNIEEINNIKPKYNNAIDLFEKQNYACALNIFNDIITICEKYLQVNVHLLVYILKDYFYNSIIYAGKCNLHLNKNDDATELAHKFVYWIIHNRNESIKDDCPYDVRIILGGNNQEKENFIFKYRDINEYTSNNIKNKTITVSNPKEFNDPFDCIYNISPYIFENNEFSKL